MRFDETGKVNYDGTDVAYGCVWGSNQILYIKVGRGGSYLGSENRYLRIARLLNEKHGYSVICASNPLPLPIDVDLTILNAFIETHGLRDPEMLFFGYSNGCVKGLELSAHGVPFTKMVLVNMPLMINFHKAVQRISAIPSTEIVAIYGDMDPSYPYISLFHIRNLENVRTITISGADHNFKGMSERLIELTVGCF